MKVARRGVLMTASSRKARPSWQDRMSREADEDEVEIKESHKEWETLEREAREEMRLKYAERSFTSGRRDAEVTTYDDAVSDAEEPEPPRPSREQEQEEPMASPSAQECEREREPSVSPPAPGFRQDQSKRRGGRKPGSKKRKKEEGDKEGEEGAQKEKQKRKKDEDPNRWLQMKLEGEENKKRIDATRVVSYYDFDTAGALFRDTQPAAAEATEEAQPPPAGNLRASVSLDIWGNDSDEGDGPLNTPR